MTTLASWISESDPGDEQPRETVRGMISRAYHAQQHFFQRHDVQLEIPNINPAHAHLYAGMAIESLSALSDSEPLWATEQEKAQLDAGETAEELTARLWMPWDGVSWHDQRFSVIVFDTEGYNN